MQECSTYETPRSQQFIENLNTLFTHVYIQEFIPIETHFIITTGQTDQYEVIGLVNQEDRRTITILRPKLDADIEANRSAFDQANPNEKKGCHAKRQREIRKRIRAS